MGTSIDVLESIAEVDRGEWEALVEASAAPIFYRYDFLLSYERAPLQNLDRLMYLIVRDQGRVSAGLPIHLQTKPDPLGVLSSLLPEGERSALLTHVLHCYDTRLLAIDLSERIVNEMCSRLGSLAREVGVAWIGFLNVDGSQSLFKTLRSAGFSMTPTDSRYRLNLLEPSSLDELLSSLTRKFRKELRRMGRRAQEAGARITVRHPPLSNLDGVIDLFRLTASKHRTAAYYPPDKLEEFLQGVGDAVRLISIHLDEVLLAAATCFQDGAKFHMWAGGARYDLTSFSPYYVLFGEIMKNAYASGSTVAEGGRGNGRFKEQFGMTAVPLFACLRRV